MRNEVAFVTTTRCHLKEIGHKTEDRRNPESQYQPRSPVGP